jgi:hypothetical protein
VTEKAQTGEMLDVHKRKHRCSSASALPTRPLESSWIRAGGFRQGQTKGRRAHRRPDRRHWPTNEAVQGGCSGPASAFSGRADARQPAASRLLPCRPWRSSTLLAPLGRRGAERCGSAWRPGIELLLFADRAEDVIFSLLDQQIPWREAERLMRYPRGDAVRTRCFASWPGTCRRADRPAARALRTPSGSGHRASLARGADSSTRSREPALNRARPGRRLSDRRGLYRFEIGR